MKILYRTNKGKLMDTMERYYIYKETQLNNQINDKNITKPNIIFDTIVHENTNRARTTNSNPPTNASVTKYDTPTQHVPTPETAQRKYHNNSIQYIIYVHSYLT
jgi:hypothetical protein